jgi:hypothetical protein
LELVLLYASETEVSASEVFALAVVELYELAVVV